MELYRQVRCVPNAHRHGNLLTEDNPAGRICLASLKIIQFYKSRAYVLLLCICGQAVHSVAARRGERYLEMLAMVPRLTSSVLALVQPTFHIARLNHTTENSLGLFLSVETLERTVYRRPIGKLTNIAFLAPSRLVLSISGHPFLSCYLALILLFLLRETLTFAHEKFFRIYIFTYTDC